MDTDRPPSVTRGVRIGFLATLHCALIVTTAFLFVPYTEILTRWRRTGPYRMMLVLYTVLLRVCGIPWPWAIPAGALLLFLAMTVILVGLIRWRTDDMWHVRNGMDGAVILTGWSSRRRRQELHTWATFRHHRGLGRLVLAAALKDAPRPLWLEPATPGLAGFYATGGAEPDPAGSHWMVLN